MFLGGYHGLFVLEEALFVYSVKANDTSDHRTGKNTQLHSGQNKLTLT